MLLSESERRLVERDIEAYLDHHRKRDLLRFVTVGSVDDGKSTLIGRLLHDTHGIYDDQLQAAKQASKRNGVELDFSLFTDGLKAEREQGITIDVAYRYFATDRRKFIIADTPGHVQYTRNMATGASTAHLAVILIDARLGILQQSRRHAYLANLLGIPELVVCINKMDLVDYDEDRFRQLQSNFKSFCRTLDFKRLTFLPVSALRGDNVVERSTNMPWHRGSSLLRHLETTPLEAEGHGDALRFPVQTVLRGDLDHRSYAGQLASGRVGVGDRVTILPSGAQSVVTAIEAWKHEPETAFAPMSVALRLADEIDVSRGDMIVGSRTLPKITHHFSAMLVWMSDDPLQPNSSFLLKHTSQTVNAKVEGIVHTVDLEALSTKPATQLGLNDIAQVNIRSQRKLFFDPYRESRKTGSFILIDPLSNNTVAAGMFLISRDTPKQQNDASDLATASGRREYRQKLLGQRGGILSIRGSHTQGEDIARRLEINLLKRGKYAVFVENEEESHATWELASRLADVGLWAIVEEVRESKTAKRSARQINLCLPDSAIEDGDVQVSASEPEAAVTEILEELQRRKWL